MTIAQAFTLEHRACDQAFAALEAALESDDMSLQQRWQALAQGLQEHFAWEEEALFPAFERATGITRGPTQVMRMEHAQMRELLAAGEAAMAQGDEETLASILETLHVMHQQHNMKEENVLYPLCDAHLNEDERAAILAHRGR